MTSWSRNLEPSRIRPISSLRNWRRSNTKSAKNKAIEKGEAVSQEAELRHRFRLEEAKSRDLKAEVQALKEDSRTDEQRRNAFSAPSGFSVLQQRFMEEENKNKSMGQEVLHLTKELEAVQAVQPPCAPA